MRARLATAEDCPPLAELNVQLIRDEGHRNPMSLEQLEARMRGWLTSGEYRAVLFEDERGVTAYALFREADDEVHLRQFFVVGHRRRQGLGRRAIEELMANWWPRHKRLTVSVLTGNAAGVAFWRSMGYADYDLTLEIMPRSGAATTSYFPAKK